MREIGVGLLGLGNVGSGVVRLLEDNAAAIESRLGARLVVRAVAVRDRERPRRVDVDESLLTLEAHDIVARDDVEIVCELIGGHTAAFDLVTAAFAAGKQVVTANKALLALRGEEVFAAAEKRGVDLYYEAAVCGGIPIIRSLREGLASDRVESIMGIVNGTSNFIVSAMATGRRSFAEVLAEAQDAGYAEADPTLDVGGGDAAHKLAILSALCFGSHVHVDDIHVEGIDRLTAFDYEMARNFGFVIKPLAIGRRCGERVELRVHPAMVPESWMLARVPDSKNAVYVHSYALGASMYYGAGAGMMPTAMSVVSDVIEVARNMLAGSTGARPQRRYQSFERCKVLPMSELETSFYLHFRVVDEPGVLGKISTVLGAHEVSISELVQRQQGAAAAPVSIALITHVAREGEVQAALREIDTLGVCLDSTNLVRIEGALP